MKVITIKGHEIALNYTFRGLILYEGLSKQYPYGGNVFSTVALLWCFIRAEIDRQKLDINLSLDEFINWVDDDQKRYHDCVNWLNEEQARQVEFIPEVKEEEKKSR